MYIAIRLLLLFRPFISSIFFLSNFQTLNIFVERFPESVRPTELKLDAYVNNRWMYCVYGNQAAAAYWILYFFFSSNIKNFRRNFLRNCEAYKVLQSLHFVYTLTMCECVELLLIIPPFIYSFSFFSNSQSLQIFSSHFSQNLRGLQN